MTLFGGYSYDGVSAALGVQHTEVANLGVVNGAFWRARKSIALLKLAGVFCVWLLPVMPFGGQCLRTLKISQKVSWLSIVDPFFILGWNWLQKVTNVAVPVNPLLYCGAVLTMIDTRLRDRNDKPRINFLTWLPLLPSLLGELSQEQKISDVFVYLYLHGSGQYKRSKFLDLINLVMLYII